MFNFCTLVRPTLFLKNVFTNFLSMLPIRSLLQFRPNQKMAPFDVEKLQGVTNRRMRISSIQQTCAANFGHWTNSWSAAGIIIDTGRADLCRSALRLRVGERAQRCCRLLHSSEDDSKHEIKIDLDAINRNVEEELAKANQGMPTELSKNFMDFQRKREHQQYLKSTIISWKGVAVLVSLSIPLITVLYGFKRMREEEVEKQRKMAIGKARLGGEWEMSNVDGKLEGSKDLLGKWVLIYFGFTNCPDICPDEIEKMIDVVDMLNREEASISIVPVFISVDPERDTIERVRTYCSEFSPKLRGYTGTKEQVAKITKAFRVYYSEGPRAQRPDDYIVDHSVIMYLVDPEGNFHDYYGQNRRSREVVNVIKLKSMEWEGRKRKEDWWKALVGSKMEKQQSKAIA